MVSTELRQCLLAGGLRREVIAYMYCVRGGYGGTVTTVQWEVIYPNPQNNGVHRYFVVH